MGVEDDVIGGDDIICLSLCFMSLLSGGVAAAAAAVAVVTAVNQPV